MNKTPTVPSAHERSKIGNRKSKILFVPPSLRKNGTLRPSLRYVHILLLLILTGCSSPAPAASRASALYLYHLDPSTLLQLSRDRSSIDREMAFPPIPGCGLSGLYPSPAGDLLAAEYACRNGPLTLLFSPTDGTARPLVSDPTVDSHFLSWAADGASLYLRLNAIADPNIQRVDIRTLRATPLPIDPYTYDLSATPDGKRILFSLTRGLGFGSELWSARPDGRAAQRILAEAENIIAYARPSPDGGRIMFIKIPDSETPYTTGELWVMDADGSDPRPLADADAGHGYAAAWSPDSKRLAFVVRSNPQDLAADRSLDALVSNIAVIDLASGKLTQVTQFSRGSAETPVWSPDGNSLQFGFVLDGRMEVREEDLRAGTVTTLPGAPSCCPAWLRK